MPTKKKTRDNLPAETVLAAREGSPPALAALGVRMEPLVVAAAEKMARGSSVPREDLEQGAWIGIMEALGSYDPEKGSFETWSYYPMRGAMATEAVKYVSGPSMPSSSAKKYLRAVREGGDLQGALRLWEGEGGTKEAFLAAHEVFSGTFSVDSFSDPEDEDDSGNARELPSAEDFSEEVATRAEAEAWLSALPMDEAFILAALYGIGVDQASEERIADLLGISRATVNRRKARAIIRLRRLIENGKEEEEGG